MIITQVVHRRAKEVAQGLTERLTRRSTQGLMPRLTQRR